MIFNKSELNEKIGVVRAAISSNNVIPSTNGVLVEENVMTATCIDLTAITTLEKSDYEAGESFIIPTSAFGVLSKISASEVEISLEEETQILHINAGKYKGKFQTTSSIEFPKVTKVEECGQEIKAEKFKELLKDVVHAVSLDTAKGVLCGINLATYAGMLEVVALDGFRIAKSATPYDGDINIVMIKNAVDFIVKSNITGTMKIAQTDRFVAFYTEDFTLISRTMTEKYINYKDIIKPDNNQKLISINPKKLHSAIELFNETIKGINDKKGAIKLKVADKKLIACDDKDNSHSFFLQEVEINELDGFTDEFVIGFNPRYLLDALKVFSDEELVTIAFNTSLTPIYFYEGDNKDRTCMVLPVRTISR